MVIFASTKGIFGHPSKKERKYDKINIFSHWVAEYSATVEKNGQCLYYAVNITLTHLCICHMISNCCSMQQNIIELRAVTNHVTQQRHPNVRNLLLAYFTNSSSEKLQFSHKVAMYPTTSSYKSILV